MNPTGFKQHESLSKLQKTETGFCLLKKKNLLRRYQAVHIAKKHEELISESEKEPGETTQQNPAETAPQVPSV